MPYFMQYKYYFVMLKPCSCIIVTMVYSVKAMFLQYSYYGLLYPCDVSVSIVTFDRYNDLTTGKPPLVKCQ